MKWLYNKFPHQNFWCGNKGLPLYFAITLIGISSITAQIIFLRELVAIFYGNELIYGLILAIWLLTYSLGSGVLGRFADRIKNLKNFFILTQFLIIILLPFIIFMTRVIKSLLGIPLGVLIDLPTIILITFSALFPLTLILGFQFALGSRLLGRIGWAYMLEAAGAVIGGLLLSFILLLFLNSFQIAALLAVLLACSGLLLLRNYKLIIMPILAITLLIAAPYLDQFSSKLSWKGYNLIKSADSPYGKLAVTENMKEYNFFMDGNLLFSTADKAGAEELIHLSLLPHKDPKAILLIGEGLGGALNEISKYPIQRVDYVELDPKVLVLAKEFVPYEISPQVGIHSTDGVRFIHQIGEKYDFILVNLPDPQSALINRFYTREFFACCKNRLNKDGILVFKLSTSTAFMGAEMRALNASILKTASAVFKEIALIPGNFNYFFASDHKLNVEKDFLLKRWKERNIKTLYFNVPALSYNLAPARIKYVWDAIRFTKETKINTDLQPISYYQTLLLWTSYFHSPLKYFFGSLIKLNLLHIFTILLLIALIIKLISQRKRSILFPSVISFVGFAGMTAQVTIILTFQAQFGYLYQMIGLLTAAFMGGLALGSYLVNRNYEKIEFPISLIKILLSIFFLYLLGFLGFLIFKTTEPIFFFLYPFSSLVIGSFIGAIFPLVVKIEQQFRKEIGSLAGILYGADLLGSSLAALLVSILFVPIYGIVKTGLIAGFCVLCALVLALRSHEKRDVPC